MKENPVYLLYNTNASTVKLQYGLPADLNGEVGSREWEYEDKDEFTILYSPNDKRKYTDIKILSKTKLKERPKSAEQLHKASVEGVLMKRSNSLSTIEENLVVLRKCPQIKPLLSEAEIQQLQLLLEECRRRKQDVMDKRESNINNGLHQLFPEDQNLRRTEGDHKHTRLYDITKDMSSRRSPRASPQQFDTNNTREKAKILSQVAKNDKTVMTKSLNKWEKTKNLNSTKIKKRENNNHLTGGTREVSPQKKMFDETRSLSQVRSQNNKRKSKQSKTTVSDGSTKKGRGRSSATQSQPKQKSSKKKSKTSREYEPTEKKQRKAQTDSAKTKERTDRTARGKGDVSDQDQFNHSSEKTKFSDKKHLQKTSDDNIKSNDYKTKLKKSTDKRMPSLNEKRIEKPDKSEKIKPIIESETLPKDDNKPRSSKSSLNKQNLKKGKTDQVKTKSSTSSSNKQNLKKGKVDEVKTKTPDEAELPKDSSTNKKDGKLTQPKSSVSEKSKTTNKTEDPLTENSSLNKGKNKDRLLPGTIQYMIHYILSNPVFINLGWTLKPTKKDHSRIVTFRTVPANPLFYCFKSRDSVEQKRYPSGALALHLAEDGTGRINYPDGDPAIIITRSYAGMRLTLYSCPTKDPLLKGSFYTRIMGMFDSFGNGVVYDSKGEKILKFNQMEGEYFNPLRQNPYKWQWSCFKVLEVQRLKELLKTMVNEVKQPGGSKVEKATSSGSSKKLEPVDKVYEALLKELPYPVTPKPRIKMKTHENTFKSIILKVNNEITLRINGQDSVAVNFSAKTVFYKMDLGVRIDPQSVERIDEVAEYDKVENVQNLLSDLLHPSPSLQKLHQLLDPNTLQ